VQMERPLGGAPLHRGAGTIRGPNVRLVSPCPLSVPVTLHRHRPASSGSSATGGSRW
jgi:hypothetical protein